MSDYVKPEDLARALEEARRIDRHYTSYQIGALARLAYEHRDGGGAPPAVVGGEATVGGRVYVLFGHGGADAGAWLDANLPGLDAATRANAVRVAAKHGGWFAADDGRPFMLLNWASLFEVPATFVSPADRPRVIKVARADAAALAAAELARFESAGAFVRAHAPPPAAPAVAPAVAPTSQPAAAPAVAPSPRGQDFGDRLADVIRSLDTSGPTVAASTTLHVVADDVAAAAPAPALLVPRVRV